MARPAPAPGDDAFKRAEKRYRRQKSRSLDDPLFKDALDCARLCTGSKWAGDLVDLSASYPGRRVLARSRIFALRSRPGFLLATNPFTAEQQRAWCSRCVLGFLHDTNQSNVDALYGPVLDGLWPAACRGETVGQRCRGRPREAQCPVAPRAGEMAPSASVPEGGGPACGSPRDDGRQQPLPARALLNKVRWVTLGHHYDWTRRQYPPGAVTPFPVDAGALAAAVAAELGLSLRPEAAIVNFYRPSSTMGGHRDDLEATFEHPVVSVSLGLPCLFLLGARDRGEEPVPLFVRSGDILVLSGESRLAVHGVPVVFNHSCPPHLTCSVGGAYDARETGARDEGCGAGELWPQSTPFPTALTEEAHAAHLAAFMSRTRVNLNVRQVPMTLGREINAEGIGQVAAELDQNRPANAVHWAH